MDELGFKILINQWEARLSLPLNMLNITKARTSNNKKYYRSYWHMLKKTKAQKRGILRESALKSCKHFNSSSIDGSRESAGNGRVCLITLIGRSAVALTFVCKHKHGVFFEWFFYCLREIKAIKGVRFALPWVEKALHLIDALNHGPAWPKRQRDGL